MPFDPTIQAGQLLQCVFPAAGLVTIVLQLRNLHRQRQLQNIQLSLQQDTAAVDLALRLHLQADGYKELDVLLLKRLGNKDTSPMSEDDIYRARQFLRFCEIVMLALEHGVLKNEEVYLILGRRLFRAMEDPSVRTELLCNGREPNLAFCSVFALHERLFRYLKDSRPDLRQEFANHGVPEQNLSSEICYLEAISHYRTINPGRSASAEKTPPQLPSGNN